MYVSGFDIRFIEYLYYSASKNPIRKVSEKMIFFSPRVNLM